MSLGFQSGSLGLSHTFEVIRISVVIEVSMEKWARETAQKVPVGRTLDNILQTDRKRCKGRIFVNSHALLTWFMISYGSHKIKDIIGIILYLLVCALNGKFPRGFR